MKDEGHQRWWPFFFAQKIMSCRTGALRAGDHFAGRVERFFGLLSAAKKCPRSLVALRAILWKCKSAFTLCVTSTG
jgi:hypothetical protein